MTRKADPAAGPEQVAAFRARRTARVDLSAVETRLSPRDLYNVEIKVHNLSTAGFMAECAAPIRIGSYVTLEIPGIGPVQAQVRWQIGVRMGGMFLDPISLKSCDWTAEKASETV
jgi:hypothetical protein